MSSRLLHLRIWLERNGLFPRGRLAFLTCYVIAIDLLLFIVQKVAGLLHQRFGSFLGGWVIFLSLIVIVLLFVLAVRRISSRLLWRMRNRLIVTYVFIGVVPLLLLVSLAALSFYLFAGQFATYIVSSKLDSEFHRLRAENAVITAEVTAGLASSQSPKVLETLVKTSSDTSVAAWLAGKPLFSVQANPAQSALPGKLQPDFTAVVRDGNSLFVRSVAIVQTKQGKLTVISSTPLGRRVLLDMASGLGEITIEQAEKTSLPVPSPPLDTEAASLRPTLTVGNIPAARNLFDTLPVGFSTSISIVDWADGHSANSAAIDVQTRASALYDHLFAAPGAFAATVEAALLAAAIVFAIIELIALWIGTRLTRTVTSTVAQLYLGTTHVNRGDFSHRIPISSNDQLATLASSFNLMTESIERLVLEQKEKQRLQHEITIAQEVQNQLFPRRVSQMARLEVHGFCRPARSVSGDYYDFLSVGSERLILAVGDVSGKGISAALLMATIHSAVRAYSLEGIPIFRQMEAVGAGGTLSAKYEPIIPGAEVSPGTMLSLLNHQLYHSTPMEKYATLFLAMYDGHQRRLTYSNAGHLPPLLIAEDGSCRRLECGGTVVGLFDDISYDEGAVQLSPGDLLLAYSDGVTEPENEFGEFGEERLLEIVQDSRDLPLDQISEIVTSAVDDWIGAAEQPDDVTLVLARAR
jgi:phosphoserine phosphatase RsbU/P